jgi:hypothetical protein
MLEKWNFMLVLCLGTRRVSGIDRPLAAGKAPAHAHHSASGRRGINQDQAGGARDCAGVQIASGLGDWKNSEGWVRRPATGGSFSAEAGSRPGAVQWVAQNVQCSRLTGDFSVDGEPGASAAVVTLTILMPAALQISVQASLRLEDMACDTDGASAANSIAKQAIQAAQRWVIVFMTMAAL